MTTRRALLAALAAAPVALAQEETGFTPLFNGKNLDGWTLVHGRGPGYVVTDGVIECPKEGGGNLFTEKEYSDFILRLEWRVWEGSNNGVGIRAPLEGDAAYVGMEIQILDEESAMYHGKEPIKPEQYTGSVYGVFAAKHGFVKRNGVWNTEEIMAKGTKIKVTLNGTVITDVDLATVKDPEVLKKHPGLLRKSGHVGFLGHGSKVEFRNIRIKTLA
ncbi:3-keto-disaccharide hydrolase [Paludibaculum fermentans]|uniref:DUF1080 domain-containing protein n=1 Tax=Paludibaculum fermentans TaxID=1473598 RepID=A0A7S7NN14_PALFE|nr:DUF1080 domain-containing protein [Paludibaculum fermentans]QOY86651.1 DUF1080 domain-containing protein [Paludibaculum fermentans]